MTLLPVFAAVKSLRSSKTIIVLVVFVAMMLDLVMLTTLEPILPGIIYDIEHAQSLLDAVSSNSSSPFNISRSENGSIPGADTKSPGAFYQEVEGTTERAGLVLAMKPGMEILANIAVGFVVDSYGHKLPMVIGCVFNILATVGFAYATQFWMLIVTRILQAIGSSLTVVSGLALIAFAFTNESERTWANSIAFGGLSFGIIIGFPLGSTCYEFMGRASPFLIIAALMFMDGMLRLLIITPDRTECQPQTRHKKLGLGSRYFKLISDPYIILALGCNLLQHIGLGMVVATEAAWMMGRFNARPWSIGVVLVLSAVFQFGAQFITGVFAVRCGRWFFCWIGLTLSGIGYAMYPLCRSVWCVVGPESLCRAGLGAILAALSPLMAYIVDKRHNSEYGAIYGLYASSYNLGLVIGPIAGGTLMHVIGFNWMYWGTGIIFVVYALLCLLFKRIEKSSYKSVPDERTELLKEDKKYYPKEARA